MFYLMCISQIGCFCECHTVVNKGTSHIQITAYCICEGLNRFKYI